MVQDGDIDDQSGASEDYDELLITFISYGDLGIVMEWIEVHTSVQPNSSFRISICDFELSDLGSKSCVGCASDNVSCLLFQPCCAADD